MRLKDPEHNATFDLFWKTQPEPEEVFSPDMWEDEHFDMLQSTVLVRGTGKSIVFVLQGSNGVSP